uniref:hypothetical protein n=1 Tax=Thaumasiovibrio subtropicus TaxID=1891207 RepID=UPI00131BDB94
IRDEDPKNKNIHLYCTLPEWKYRIDKALNDLEIANTEYLLLSFPHQKKVTNLMMMEKFLGNHINFPYQSSKEYTRNLNPDICRSLFDCGAVGGDDHLDDELKRREDLLVEVVSLRDKVTDYIERPPLGTDLYLPKRAVLSSAKKVYELITSPAFIAELEHYIEHYKENISGESDGVIPPGPYMVKEDNWEDIFKSLAKCYAELSKVQEYCDQIWNNDLKYGLDELLAHDLPDEFTREFIRLVQGDVYDFIQEQKDTLSDSSTTGVPKTTSSTIFKHYDDLIKPMLGQLIPGAGAPGLLQVVLACYQGQITNKIYNELRFKPLSHIKLFFISLKVINGALVDGYQQAVNELARSLSLTGNSKIDNRVFGESKGTFGKFVRNFHLDLERKLSNGANKSVFDKFDWDTSDRIQTERTSLRTGSAIIRGLYASYNFVYSAQTLMAAWEKAEKEGWDDHKTYWEVVNALSGVFISATSVFNSSMSVWGYFSATRFNKLNRGLMSTLASNADRLSMYIGFAAGAVAIYDMVDHYRNNDMLAAARSGVEAMGSLASAVGLFIVRQKVVSSASAAGSAMPVLGFAMIIVGTAINVFWLAYDLIPVIRSYFKSSEQLRLEGIWSAFEEKIEPPQKLLEEYGYWSKCLVEKNSLSITSRLLSQEDMSLVIDLNPFKGYKSNTRLNCKNHIELIEKVYEYSEVLSRRPSIDTEDVIPTVAISRTSIRLQQLSWRAVVPLYVELESATSLYDSVEEIAKAVTMPEDDLHRRKFSITHNFGSQSQYDTHYVRDVVTYYPAYFNTKDNLDDSASYWGFSSPKYVNNLIQ